MRPERGYELKPAAIAMAELVLARLPQGSRIVIYPHVRADGDSYGSGLALALALQKLGYQPLVYLEEEPDLQNTFFDLASFKRVYDPADPRPAFARAADLAWMIDCSERSRLGERAAAWESAPFRLVTDHHLSDWVNSETVWIDTDEPAVASMVHDLLVAWERRRGQPLFDLQIAQALFAALMTDTGRLTYSKVSDRSFFQAGHLKQYGVDQEAIIEHFFEQMRRPRFAAYGEIVRTAQILEGGRVIVAYLSDAFQIAQAAVDTDFTGLVSWMRQLEGVDLSILLTQSNGEWRGSCRSSERADARGLAQSFGGGGHQRAAGFTYGYGSIEDALAQIRERVGAYLLPLESAEPAAKHPVKHPVKHPANHPAESPDA